MSALMAKAEEYFQKALEAENNNKTKQAEGYLKLAIKKESEAKAA